MSLPPEELGLSIKSGTHVTGIGKGMSAEIRAAVCLACSDISQRIAESQSQLSSLTCLSVCSYQLLATGILAGIYLHFEGTAKIVYSKTKISLVRPSRTKIYFQSRF